MRVCYSSANDLAITLSSQGRPAAAVPYFYDAIRRSKLALGPDAAGIAVPTANLGKAHYLSGDFKGAEPWYRKALAIQDRVIAHGGKASSHPIGLYNLSSVLILENRLPEAAATLDEVRHSVTQTGTAVLEMPVVMLSWANTAEIFRRRGDLASADRAMAHSVALAAGLTETNPNRALVETEQGYLLLVQHRAIEAEHVLRHALLIWAHATYPDDPRAAHTEAALGVALSEQGRKAEARSALQHSVAVLTRKYGPTHPWTMEAVSTARSVR